ncbi:protein PF3D7_1417600 [Polyergus mexicanus]|uniref:protein PF3D7_1417600 n=1 Tax=Polyergus mexicanus TaxID=615972 RepID=UPI0038B5C5C4
MSQSKIMEDKSIMDCAVKNLEKTFDIKQKALLNKLHNMHWLKNMSPSSNPEKIKIIYKHIQERERDHDKDNKLEDKSLLTGNIKTSVEESDKYRLMGTYRKYLPNDAMSGSDENVWNKDVNSPHLFQNSKKLINQKDKDEEEEDMLMITESIKTAKLDAQFYTDKMQKDQSNMSQNNAEDITQNAICSNLSNIKTESNKTADVTYQNKNIKKNAILQKQQTVSKQSVSKMQESSLKKNASTLNFAIYKSKALEKTKKVNNLSQKSDLHLNEERRNKKIIDEKQCHQKENSDCNLKTTFAMQYENSTFANPLQNKSMLRNIEHIAIYGRNSSYNDPRFDNKSIGNAERKSVINSEYISTNVFSKSNVKSTIHKKDTSACNNENKVNPVNAKTYLTVDKKCANLSIGHKQKSVLGQCRKEMKKIDKSKININQENIEVNNVTDNEQTNSFKHSSNLLSNRYTVETPADVIHQHSLKLECSQHMDDVKKLGSSQTTWNNCLSNSTVQKNPTIVNSQQSIQNMRFNVQKTIMQATDQTKQMPSRESNSSKFYNQHFSISNAMPPTQIPNTFNVAPYKSNVQTSNDSDSILETTMNRNKESSDIHYKYTPNIQQRSVTTFSDFTGHSVLSGQTRKWNSSIDSFHVDSYNIMQPTLMQTYNSGAFDPNDFNNTHIRDWPPHPIIYAPSPNVQTRNPQLQYPLPVSYNPPCTNYIRVIPNTINQLNNFNNIGCMHDQQLKYIPCMQMNNYIRGTHSDLSNCTVQPRNAVDNVPMKSNQHYKMCQDNSRMVYNVSRYVTPLSYSGVQKDMNFMPAISKNQCSNAYFWQNQKDNQNRVNYMQMSKYPKNQTIQDLACDDNESENIPPIISPKEFMTNNVSFSNKTEQFTARV